MAGADGDQRRHRHYLRRATADLRIDGGLHGVRCAGGRSGAVHGPEQRLSATGLGQRTRCRNCMCRSY
ncbi:polyketide synthase docking domain-containing protein [Pseudomonas sp. CVAP|nr:polyketide synthase docking domain-containing protein [Pseudomonas sp. CVAP\